jgi:hypothetical protein
MKLDIHSQYEADDFEAAPVEDPLPKSPFPRYHLPILVNWPLLSTNATFAPVNAFAVFVLNEPKYAYLSMLLEPHVSMNCICVSYRATHLVFPLSK